MTKEIIKKAIEQAEQEAQETEIKKIKDIVKGYLENIQKETKIQKQAVENIRLYKKDLDDLKAGRLDKIKERQEKDSVAKEKSLIIIKKVEKEYIPYYPWRSPWIIEYKQLTHYYDNSATGLVGTNSMNISDSSYSVNDNSMTVTGQVVSNFVQGSYNIKGKIINI